MASQNMTLAPLADDVLELEDNGGRISSIWRLAHLSDSTRVAWHFLTNITLEKCIFLYFLTHFNVLDLCLWLRGDFVLDFWIVAISCNTLQHFARDNFGILQTLKFCLIEASWVFITCPLKYLDWRPLNFL